MLILRITQAFEAHMKRYYIGLNDGQKHCGIYYHRLGKRGLQVKGQYDEKKRRLEIGGVWCRSGHPGCYVPRKRRCWILKSRANIKNNPRTKKSPYLCSQRSTKRALTRQHFLTKTETILGWPVGSLCRKTHHPKRSRRQSQSNGGQVIRDRFDNMFPPITGTFLPTAAVCLNAGRPLYHPT